MCAFVCAWLWNHCHSEKRLDVPSCIFVYFLRRWDNVYWLKSCTKKCGLVTHSATNTLLHMMTSSNCTFSALLAICAWKSPVIGEFPAQKPVTRSFDIFFYLRNFARFSNYLGCYWLQYLEIGMNSLGLETCIMRHHQVDLILVAFFFYFTDVLAIWNYIHVYIKFWIKKRLVYHILPVILTI